MKTRFQKYSYNHNCESWREGNVIYFKCTKCDYLRSLDFFTSKTKIINDGDVNAGHGGVHVPLSQHNIIKNEN